MKNAQTNVQKDEKASTSSKYERASAIILNNDASYLGKVSIFLQENPLKAPTSPLM